MKNFLCDCGQPVFFENSTCLECGSSTGFDPVAKTLLSLQPSGAGAWQREGTAWKFCANLDACGCNWLLPAQATETLCPACMTTRMLPDLSSPPNQQRWQRLETAKRRLLYTLLDYGLWGPNSRMMPVLPLMFDFKEATASEAVTTGHQNGVITLNVAEADDDQRERMRLSLYEPYRTLLGHLRHEVGHYYWDLLIKDGPWLQECRQLFGDDTLDYVAAMQGYYQQGPSANWRETHVSAYATMHPWEDWAETWAHCMHMHDTLETADHAALTTRISGAQHDSAAFIGIAGATQINAVDLTLRMTRWTGIVILANELSRSMGQSDVYPFALTLPVLKKLFFIERVIRSWAGNN